MEQISLIEQIKSLTNNDFIDCYNVLFKYTTPSENADIISFFEHTVKKDDKFIRYSKLFYHISYPEISSNKSYDELVNVLVLEKDCLVENIKKYLIKTIAQYFRLCKIKFQCYNEIYELNTQIIKTDGIELTYKIINVIQSGKILEEFIQPNEIMSMRNFDEYFGNIKFGNGEHLKSNGEYADCDISSIDPKVYLYN